MKPILVFQTDFTYAEGAVSSMYGVVKTVDRELEIFDGTHDLPQFDTWSASYRLYQSLPFWPVGTIYVSVVDPGVGTPRRACVAKTKDGHYVVTPDNGALTHVMKYIGVEEVREIDQTINRLHGMGTDDVAVFHGRDLFGYCAARLASGIISYEQVGPAYPVSEIVLHDIKQPEIKQGYAKGIFEIDDPNFGNMWTNIPMNEFKAAGFEYGDMVNVKITRDGKTAFEQKVLFHQSFGYAQKGDPMIYTNELVKLGLAVSQGSMEKLYNLGYGPEWIVEFSK